MNLRGKRILIVEDEALICLDLQVSLERAGATCTVMRDAASAEKELARGAKFDAAVVDYLLADGSGQPLYQLLATFKVPFLIYTGYSIDSLEAEGAPILSKPAEEGVLVRALDLLVTQRLACALTAPPHAV